MFVPSSTPMCFKRHVLWPRESDMIGQDLKGQSLLLTPSLEKTCNANAIWAALFPEGTSDSPSGYHSSS